MLKLSQIQRAQIAASFLSNKRGDFHFGAVPALPDTALLGILDRILNETETEADQKVAAILMNDCPYVAPEHDDRRYLSWKRTAAYLSPLMPDAMRNIPLTYARMRELLNLPEAS